MTHTSENLKETEEMEFTTTLGTAVFMTNEPARDVRRKQSAQARRLRLLSREAYANDLFNQTNRMVMMQAPERVQQSALAFRGW